MTEQPERPEREGFQVTNKVFTNPSSALDPTTKRQLTICNLFANHGLSIPDIVRVLDETAGRNLDVSIATWSVPHVRNWRLAMTENSRRPPGDFDTTRRRLLASTGAALGALALPRFASAQSTGKVRIGYWPIAAGLPFYVAVERGYFKEAGLDVEPLKFAGAQQVMEAMVSGRADGSANGTGSANLAIGEIASPGLFKIIVSNPSNAKNVLDEFLVAANSPTKSISELKGKKVGSGPGIQNVTLCKTVLERSGVTDATVIELPIGQHVASIAAGQIDAVYTLEPTGTVGRLNGTTRPWCAARLRQRRYVLGATETDIGFMLCRVPFGAKS